LEITIPNVLFTAVPCLHLGGEEKGEKGSVSTLMALSCHRRGAERNSARFRGQMIIYFIISEDHTIVEMGRLLSRLFSSNPLFRAGLAEAGCPGLCPFSLLPCNQVFIHIAKIPLSLIFSW